MPVNTTIDWRNKKEVLEKVRKKGWYLEFASEKLRGDEEVVLASFIQDGFALFWAADALKDSEEFLWKCWDVGGRNELTKRHDIYTFCSTRIRERLRETPTYLDKFEPMNVKPARQDTTLGWSVK